MSVDRCEVLRPELPHAEQVRAGITDAHAELRPKNKASIITRLRAHVLSAESVRVEGSVFAEGIRAGRTRPTRSAAVASTHRVGVEA